MMMYNKYIKNNRKKEVIIMLTMKETLEVMQMLGLQSGGLATRDAMLTLTPIQAAQLEEFVRTEDNRRTQMRKEFAKLLNSFGKGVDK
jgi:hypothetical protein